MLKKTLANDNYQLETLKLKYLKEYELLIPFLTK